MVNLNIHSIEGTEGQSVRRVTFLDGQVMLFVYASPVHSTPGTWIPRPALAAKLQVGLARDIARTTPTTRPQL